MRDSHESELAQIEPYDSEQFLPCVFEYHNTIRELIELKKPEEIDILVEQYMCNNDHGCCARSCGILW